MNSASMCKGKYAAYVKLTMPDMPSMVTFSTGQIAYQKAIFPQ
jgi:hypothetical protein